MTAHAKKAANPDLRLPVIRDAEIHDAARVLETTADDLRAMVARGEAIGVRTAHGNCIKIQLLPGAAAPVLVTP